MSGGLYSNKSDHGRDVGMARERVFAVGFGLGPVELIGHRAENRVLLIVAGEHVARRISAIADPARRPRDHR